MINRGLSVSVLLAGLPLCASCAGPERGPSIQFLNPPTTEFSDLPFSQAVRVGDMLYLSGQIGNLPGTKQLAPGGIEGQTRQAMENIKAVLERNGSGLDRVVKCTVFLADIGEWPRMNDVYRTFFPDNRPARSAVAGSGLALGARVEIECIAVVGTSTATSKMVRD